MRNNTCPAQPTALPVGATLSCSFDAYLAGTALGPDRTSTLTAAVTDDDGNRVAASERATVGFSDVPPSISVSKTPSTGTVPEPGATVTFTVEVANTSAKPVTLSALTDDRFGNLLDPGNPAVSANRRPPGPIAPRAPGPGRPGCLT